MSVLGPSYGSVNADSSVGLFNDRVITYSKDINNYNVDINFRDNAARQRVSFMFVLDQTRVSSYVDIWMRRVGTIIGDVSVLLCPEGAGVGIPDHTAPIVSSAAINVSNIGITYTRISFDIGGATLNPATNYYIVLESTVAVNVSNYMQVAADSTPVGYTRSATHNGAAWSVGTSDGCSEVFCEAPADLGIAFRASGTQELNSVDFYLYRLSAPGGNLFATIYEASDFKPILPALGVSAALLANSVAVEVLADPPVAYTFDFSASGVILQDGQRYVVVLSAPSSTLNSTNNIFMRTDTSTPTYLDGWLVAGEPSDQSWYLYENLQVPVFQIYYEDLAPENTLADELAALGEPPACYDPVWTKAFVDVLSTFYPNVLPPEFGGTGISIYEPGDMLYATDLYHLEKLSIGQFGQFLSVGVDGLPTWEGSGSRLVQTVHNNSGVLLDIGDVVLLDQTNYALSSNPVVMLAGLYGGTTIWAPSRFAGVVAAPIPSGQSGPVITHGVGLVRTQSNVVAGDSLWPSQTARYAKNVTSPNTFKSGQKQMVALAPANALDLVPVYINATAKVHGAKASLMYKVAFNVNGPSFTINTQNDWGHNTGIDPMGLLTSPGSIAAPHFALFAGHYSIKVHGVLAIVATGGFAQHILSLSSAVDGPYTVNMTQRCAVLGHSTSASNHGASYLEAEVDSIGKIGLKVQTYPLHSAAGTVRGGTAHGAAAAGDNTYLTIDITREE